MITYDFYKTSYHGSSISESEWPCFEARAAEQLAYYKRIYTVVAPEDTSEAMSVCAIADAYAAIAAAQTVSSASIGSVSVSYNQSSIDLSPRGQSRELYNAAKRYLQIYRG